MNSIKGLSTERFAGISMFSGKTKSLLDFVSQQLEGDTQVSDQLMTIFTPNPEQLVLAHENDRFYSVLKAASLCLPDGSGLVWAINREGSRAQKLHRVAGREVFHDLLKMAEQRSFKVFLLGGSLGAAKAILKKYKREDWQFDDGPRENNQEALDKITRYCPDIVFVAYGAPWQELWIADHREFLLEAGVKAAMVVGGAFDYESGRTVPVSALVTRLHMEWLQRLLLEPWRWSRQLKGVKFFWWVLIGKYN